MKMMRILKIMSGQLEEVAVSAQGIGGTDIIGTDTKIKYIKINDKLYEVTDISFYYMTIRAVELSQAAARPEENEIFDVSDFKEFKISLVNNGGQGEIIDFTGKGD